MERRTVHENWQICYGEHHQPFDSSASRHSLICRGVILEAGNKLDDGCNYKLIGVLDPQKSFEKACYFLEDVYLKDEQNVLSADSG